MIHNQQKQKLLVLDGVFAVYQFDKKGVIDLTSLEDRGFFSVTFTDEEVSVVTTEDFKLNSRRIEKGWRCLKIQGQLDFDMIGVIHGILKVLMKAEVSVFVISTYSTDYFLVRENMLRKAMQALSHNGYEIEFA